MPIHPYAPNDYFNALSDEKRKEILSSDFGRSLLLSGLEYAVPFWWVFEDHTNSLTLRNGSAFLVNCGHGIFAVTAAHGPCGIYRGKSKIDQNRLSACDVAPAYGGAIRQRMCYSRAGIYPRKIAWNG